MNGASNALMAPAAPTAGRRSRSRDAHLASGASTPRDCAGASQRHDPDIGEWTRSRRNRPTQCARPLARCGEPVSLCSPDRWQVV